MKRLMFALLCGVLSAGMIACKKSSVSEKGGNESTQAANTASNPFAGNVNQFGYVVPNLEDSMKDWLGQGIGPWFILGPGIMQDNVYRGKQSIPRIVIALTQVGGIQLELIQPLDQEASAYRDFLAAGNNGLEHCGFYVDEQAYQRTVQQGISTGAKVQEAASTLGNAFTYMFMAEPIRSPMDRIQLGDVSPAKAEVIRKSVAKGCAIGEIIPMSNAITIMFGNVSKQSAQWDGKTEPIRHVLKPLEEAGFNTVELALRVNRWYKERNAGTTKPDK